MTSDGPVPDPDFEVDLDRWLLRSEEAAYREAWDRAEAPGTWEFLSYEAALAGSSPVRGGVARTSRAAVPAVATAVLEGGESAFQDLDAGEPEGGGFDPTARKSGEDIRVGDGKKPGHGDEQGEALAEALTALAQGLYDGDSDQFYADIESILEWDHPSWINPDPISPGCGPVPLSECGPAPTYPHGQFSEVPVVPEGDAFTFDNSYSECERQLLGQAWGLLQANLDIVEWALCIANRMARQNGAAFQEQNDEDCLARTIQGLEAPILFEKNLDRKGCKMGTGPGRQVFMCVAGPNDLFEQAVQLYCEGGAAAQRCAVLAIASSLFHELSHTCGYEHDKPIVDCSIPYLLGSLFSWAIQEKYPHIADHGCCGRMRRIQLGADDKLPGFTEGCT